MRPESPLSEALMRAFEARAAAEQIVFRLRSGARQAYRGADLSSMAGEMAQTLQLWLGSAPCRIVVALPAGPDFVTLLLGGVLAGVTVVPVPVPRHGSHTERFRHIVADSRASAVICLPEHAGIITAELTRQGPASCPVVPLPLNPAHLPEPARAAGDTARLAVIQYTSGSTRFPKGVAITGDNILANAGLVARSWGLGPSSRFVNWLPHYHDMGLMGGILTPLLCGGFSAQMGPLDFIRKPALWPEAVSAERATISGGPAFAFAECVQRVTADQIAGMDLSTWSCAFCGAEPVPAELPEQFHAHFAPAGLSRAAVFACYGMAEMTLFASGQPGPSRAAPAAAKSMAPCLIPEEQRDRIAIVSPETTRPVARGKVGEIWLRGASKGQGYIGLPDESAAQFEAWLDGERGWLRTGDLGLVEGDALYVVGRLRDVLICKGRKISAPEIEWLACKMSPALNPMAAAAFMPDQNRGGHAVLIVETRMGAALPEADALADTLRRTVRGEWALELDEVRFVPRGRLPRTSSGKVRRAAAAEMWRQGTFDSAPQMAEVPSCPS